MTDPETPPADDDQRPDILDPAETLDPNLLTRTYMIPPGTPINEYIEICLDAFDDDWVARIELDAEDAARHRVVVYNATETIIGNIRVEARITPDNIGDVTADPPDPIGPPDTAPVPPGVEMIAGRVTAKALNVRSTPGVLASNKVGVLAFDAAVWILPDSPPNWWRILWDKPGDPWAFISRKYVRLE